VYGRSELGRIPLVLQEIKVAKVRMQSKWTDHGQKNNKKIKKNVPKAWRTLPKGLCANSSLWCHHFWADVTNNTDQLLVGKTAELKWQSGSRRSFAGSVDLAQSPCHVKYAWSVHVACVLQLTCCHVCWAACIISWETSLLHTALEMSLYLPIVCILVIIIIIIIQVAE